jgi:glucosamine--fructose-6-phosphate aminotransferase (isomerizing)
MRDVLYLGRGTSYPLALEGALKLKEISYIHAEGYAAGELKHGPIALIDENMPVMVIAPFDRVFEKTVSNMQEVAARGGNIILMTDAKGAAEATIESLVTIVLPDMAATLTPMVYAIPVQLIGLSHRRGHGHRRRPAAQSREIGHGGIGKPGRASGRWR